MSRSVELIQIEGAPVSLKGEMVSLTGLWKAAGSDPSKQPAKWRDLPSTKELATHLCEVVLRKSEDCVFKTTRGRNAETFGHWHMAMSYARYLDPAFAVRNNEIVRAHMEKLATAPTDFSSDLAEMIRRTDGIARMLAHKVTNIEKALAEPKHETPHAEGFTITVMPTKRSAA